MIGQFSKRSGYLLPSASTLPAHNSPVPTVRAHNFYLNSRPQASINQTTDPENGMKFNSELVSVIEKKWERATRCGRLDCSGGVNNSHFHSSKCVFHRSAGLSWELDTRWRAKTCKTSHTRHLMGFVKTQQIKFFSFGRRQWEKAEKFVVWQLYEISRRELLSAVNCDGCEQTKLETHANGIWGFARPHHGYCIFISGEEFHSVLSAFIVELTNATKSRCQLESASELHRVSDASELSTTEVETCSSRAFQSQLPTTSRMFRFPMKHRQLPRLLITELLRCFSLCIKQWRNSTLKSQNEASRFITK